MNVNPTSQTSDLIHKALPFWHPVMVAARIADQTATYWSATADINAQYRVDSFGKIRDFGQFESEPVWMPVLWEYALDQCADEISTDLNGYENFFFNVDAAMVTAWPELVGVRAIAIWQTDNGFVRQALSREHDAAIWAELISEEADKHLGPVCEYCSERMGNALQCEHCGEINTDALGDDWVAYTLPAYWASYLINGDASGMDDAEQARCDEWFDAQEDIGGPCACCSSAAHFARSNDASNLGADVLTYVFPKKGSRLASK